MRTILDCFTDEPAGLGVPPYLGTYPRYLAGALGEGVCYVTIDDFRVPYRASLKSDITTYNRTGNDVKEVIRGTDELVVVAGVHTPGKYLSAVPASLKEVVSVVKRFGCRKVLTGPAGSVHGSGVEGGKVAERVIPDVFDVVDENYLGINDFDRIRDYSVKGAFIAGLHPSFPNLVAEIETARGCPKVGGCSFCVEPFKGFVKRDVEDVVDEVVALSEVGVRHFRLGKQSDFFARKADEIEFMLREIRNKVNPATLHIDNVNPVSVDEEKTELVVKYCSDGNVAAFGVESFDEVVIRENNLDSNPEIIMGAVRILNKFGAVKGVNGLPKFLPGINLLFGLKGESKRSHEANMFWLKKILDENLLLRRINIRQVVAFPGTPLFESCKNKFIKKNKMFYWKWRNEVRQNIDFPMLKRLAPVGCVLRNVLAEIYDGKTTFCRQLGTYPLIVGVKGRLPLKQFIDVRITGHMLRSLVGEKV